MTTPYVLGMSGLSYVLLGRTQFVTLVAFGSLVYLMSYRKVNNLTNYVTPGSFHLATPQINARQRTSQIRNDRNQMYSIQGIDGTLVPVDMSLNQTQKIQDKLKNSREHLMHTQMEMEHTNKAVSHTYTSSMHSNKSFVHGNTSSMRTNKPFIHGNMTRVHADNMATTRGINDPTAGYHEVKQVHVFSKPRNRTGNATSVPYRLEYFNKHTMMGPYELRPESITCTQPHTFIIYVISAAPERVNRTLMRETWLNIDHVTRLKHDGFRLERMFVIGGLTHEAPLVAEAVRQESRLYRDILTLNYLQDHYVNLSRKVMAMISIKVVPIC